MRAHNFHQSAAILLFWFVLLSCVGFGGLGFTPIGGGGVNVVAISDPGVDRDDVTDVGRQGASEKHRIASEHELVRNTSLVILPHHLDFIDMRRK